MLDIDRLGGGLNWIWNDWCAMLKMYLMWELIIQVQQSTGVRRKRGGGDRKLAHLHIVLVCASGAVWLSCPPVAYNLEPLGLGLPPFLFTVLCWPIRLGVKGQVLISEPSVNLEWCSLWSQQCFLYICICATEMQMQYKVTGAFLALFCGFRYLENVWFHWYVNQRRSFPEQKSLLRAEANIIS